MENAAGFIVVALVLAIGLIMLMVRDQAPSPAEEIKADIDDWFAKEAARSARAIEGWRVWRILNAWTAENLRANPPADRYRIDRNASGMWIVHAYKGVQEGTEWSAYLGLEPWGILRYGLGHDYVPDPPEGPYARHVYDLIGPKEGFLTRKDALKFAQGYAADDPAPLHLNEHLHPVALPQKEA